MKNMQIHGGSCSHIYRDCDTGTGKTTQAYKDVYSNLQFKHQVVVCTKITLLKQWQRDLIAEGIPLERIDLLVSDESKGAVVHRIQQWFNKNTTEDIEFHRRVLLVTFAGLKSLQKLNRDQKHCCDIWFDELPDVIQPHSVKIKAYDKILSRKFKLGDAIAKIISTLVVRDKSGAPIEDSKGELKRKQVNDAVHMLTPMSPEVFRGEFNDKSHNYEDSLRQVFQSLGSDNCVNFIKRTSWVQAGEMYGKRGDDSCGETLIVSALTRKLFVGWHSCTIMSADWMFSMGATWLCSALKLPFREDVVARKKLNNDGYHASGLIDRLEFIYVRDPERDLGVNSKRYLQGAGARVDQKIIGLLESMGQPEFILCTNNNRKSDRELISLANCTVVSPRDEGSNNYVNVNVVVADVALNLPPEIAAMYGAVGFDASSQYMSITLNTLYQISSRTSLRDKSRSSKVTIVVMDKAAAYYLAKRFASRNGGTAKIRHIDEDECQLVKIPPSLISESLASQVSGEYLTTVKSEDCTEETTLRNSMVQGVGANMYSFATGVGKAKPDHDIAARDFALAGATFQVSASKRYPRFYPCDISQLLDHLHYCSQRIVESRERSLGKLYPCVFNKYHPDVIAGARGKKNFNLSGMVILDFDGGSGRGVLSPEKAKDIFNPSRQNRKKGVLKHSFVMHSTFSCSPELPNRFRMIFFLKKPARSPEEYAAVVRYLAGKIKLAGYDIAKCGLDEASYNCVQSYWLPCINSKFPDSAFYEAVNLTKSRDVYERYGVDAKQCMLDFPPVIVQRIVRNKKSTTGQVFDLNAAIADYRSLSDGRRLGMLRLGRSCAMQGRMSSAAVECVLLSVVDSEAPEMHKRVRDTMFQLEGDIRVWGNEAA